MKYLLKYFLITLLGCAGLMWGSIFLVRIGVDFDIIEPYFIVLVLLLFGAYILALEKELLNRHPEMPMYKLMFFGSLLCLFASLSFRFIIIPIGDIILKLKSSPTDFLGSGTIREKSDAVIKSLIASITCGSIYSLIAVSIIKAVKRRK